MKSDCQEWDGYRSAAGYGRVQVDHKEWLAHRLVWTQANGPIPEGLVVRHRCDNPPCVNLEHLELGTQKENGQDMVERNRTGNIGKHHSEKTHCPQNHEYTEENTYRPPGKNERHCRTCVRERARAWYRKKKGVTTFRVPT